MMMSCSLPPPLLTLLFALLVIPSANSLPTSADWIKDACTSFHRRPFDAPFCIKLLGSFPEITNNKDPFGFLFSIIHLGTRYAANVVSVIDKDLGGGSNNPPALEAALQGCKSAYDDAASSFEQARNWAQMHAYDNAAPRLLNAGYCAYTCEQAMKDNGVLQGDLMNANRFLNVFGIAGYETAQGMW